MIENKFKAGEQVVCIKNHPKNVVTKGTVYTIREAMVNCCVPLVDVGFITDCVIAYCPECDLTYATQDNAWWMSEKLFAPLHEDKKLSLLLAASTLDETLLE